MGATRPGHDSHSLFNRKRTLVALSRPGWAPDRLERGGEALVFVLAARAVLQVRRDAHESFAATESLEFALGEFR